MAKYNKSIKGKLYQYFTGRLDLKKSTNGFIRGDCPYCGGKNGFGINIETDKVNCFRHCGIPANPIKLLMYLEDFSTYAEAKQFLKIQQEYEAYDGGTKVKVLERKDIILPESYTPLNLGDSMLSRAARKSMSKRGFNVLNLAMAGVGYCTEGPYAGYVIFPFYYQGKLEFFQGRKFAGGGPKMQNPPEEEFGIGKSQLIYNRDALYIYNRIYLVESITNANTIGERGVALLGKKASRYQVSTIIKAPCQDIIIMLDPDAIEEAIELALQLCHYKRVKLVWWKPGKDYPTGSGPDVNDLGKKKAMEIAKQHKFMKYLELYGMKLNPPYVI